MVARISFPKRLLAALNYNENKCSKGNAACIAAVNYLREAKEMNCYQKLSMFETRNELNDRAATKTIHISLNFDPSENLDEEQLKLIANAYMEKIGFGEQPFLVYKHNDAAHPHVHIVSTTIKDDGSRIHTHNIGKTVSEKARKEIEEMFGLMKAGKQRSLGPGSCKQRPQADHQQRLIVDAEKIIYGKTELKRSISNVVGYVFNNYRFSSLPEFNAALRQFNVVADRGNEDGRIYKNRGLVFRVLDEKGNKVGVPIKASLIACKPTLENLEKKFTRTITGSSARDPMKTIDEALKSSNDLESLISELKKRNIYTVLRRSEVVGDAATRGPASRDHRADHQQGQEGRIYGITFVDNERKVVFNGSDLGREYSAANLMKRMQVTKNTEEAQRTERSVLSEPSVSSVTKKEEVRQTETIIEQITSAEANYQNTPFQLRKRKKKKKLKTGH